LSFSNSIRIIESLFEVFLVFIVFFSGNGRRRRQSIRNYLEIIGFCFFDIKDDGAPVAESSTAAAAPCASGAIPARSCPKRFRRFKLLVKKGNGMSYAVKTSNEKMEMLCNSSRHVLQ